MSDTKRFTTTVTWRLKSYLSDSDLTNTGIVRCVREAIAKWARAVPELVPSPFVAFLLSSVIGIMGTPSSSFADVTGRGCSFFNRCPSGYSCQPGVHKCYPKPRKLNQPCVDGHPCGPNLSCQPGFQKCFHSPRQIMEPCSVGFACDEKLECRDSGKGYRCRPKKVDTNSGLKCSEVVASNYTPLSDGKTVAFGLGGAVSFSSVPAALGPRGGTGGAYYQHYTDVDIGKASLETGTYYGPGGKKGCYLTVCGGASSDFSVSTYASTAIYNDFDDVAGTSRVFEGGASLPVFEGLGASVGVVTDMQGRPLAVASGMSFGAGMMPIDLSVMTCHTQVIGPGEALSALSKNNARDTILAEWVANAMRAAFPGGAASLEIVWNHRGRRCLTRSGNRVRLSACSDSSAAQQWQLPAVGQSGQIKHVGSGLCLTFGGSPRRLGGPAYLSGCKPSGRSGLALLKFNRQQWVMKRNDTTFNLHGLGGVLKASGSNLVKAADSTKDTDPARWILDPTATTFTPRMNVAQTSPTVKPISGPSTLSVVSPDKGSQCVARAGTKTELRTCDAASPDQRWLFPPVGTAGPIKLVGTSLCLNFAGKPKQLGRPATLTGCRAKAGTGLDRLKFNRQQWTLRHDGSGYVIRGLGGVLVAKGSKLVKARDTAGRDGARWIVEQAKGKAQPPRTANAGPTPERASGTLLEIEWRHRGPRCLTRAKSATRLAKCELSNENQRWIVPAAGKRGQVRLSGTNLCLTFGGSPKRLGTPATVAGCRSRGKSGRDLLKFNRQQWVLVKSGSALNLHGLGGILKASGSKLVKAAANTKGSAAARWKPR